MATRFESMVARFLAGTLKPTRVRTGRRAEEKSESVRLPRGFAWLVGEMQEAAAFGCQLQALLETPEMMALLAACPRAKRVLQPLCLMLGVPARMIMPRRRAKKVVEAPAMWPAAWRSGGVEAGLAAEAAGPWPVGRGPPDRVR